MSTELVALGIVVLTALVFDFTNGFHDTANAMATSIATGALRPKRAVMLSAVLNFVGALLSVEVALTVTNAVIKIQDKSGAPKTESYGPAWSCAADHSSRGPRRGDHLEPRDLAGGAAVVVVARALWRNDRCHGGRARDSVASSGSVTHRPRSSTESSAGDLAGHFLAHLWRWPSQPWEPHWCT